MAALNDALKQNGTSLDINTGKGRANLSAVDQAITAAQQHAEAVGKQTDSSYKATQAYRDDIDALRAHMIALGYDRQHVDALIQQYAKMPRNVWTQVGIQDAASAHLSAIERELDQITGEHWNIPVGVNGSGSVRTGSGTVHFNAGGTDFFSGGLTRYDEREPEAIVPRGYKIIPTSKASHGGAQTLIIKVEVSGASMVAPDAAVGREIAKHLTEHFRNGGNLANRFGNLANVQG